MAFSKSTIFQTVFQIVFGIIIFYNYQNQKQQNEEQKARSYPTEFLNQYQDNQFNLENFPRNEQGDLLLLGRIFITPVQQLEKISLDRVYLSQKIDEEDLEMVTRQSHVAFAGGKMLEHMLKQGRGSIATYLNEFGFSEQVVQDFKNAKFDFHLLVMNHYPEQDVLATYENLDKIMIERYPGLSEQINGFDQKVVRQQQVGSGTKLVTPSQFLDREISAQSYREFLQDWMDIGEWFQGNGDIQGGLGSFYFVENQPIQDTLDKFNGQIIKL